jgi:hypothetical protein
MCSLPAEAHRGETHESHIALMLFCSACEHEPLTSPLPFEFFDDIYIHIYFRVLGFRV